MEIQVLGGLQTLQTQEEQREQQSHPPRRRSDQSQTSHPPLPSLQVPSFSGKTWEWENFWQLFRYNIHDQPISNFAKFNYLLKALSGEIQEAMGRFQIWERGYEEAVAWLQDRFGKEDVIVEQLYAKLEKLRADGRSTRDQRKLLEQISTTMTQLASKGQDVKYMQLLNQIFKKFAEEIQTKALKRRTKLQSAGMWTWQKFRDDLEGIISTRECMEETQTLNAEIQRDWKQREGIKVPVSNTRSSTCFYCQKSNHKPVECRIVPFHERTAFMIRNNLCRNCGRQLQECRMQKLRKEASHICLPGAQRECGIEGKQGSDNEPNQSTIDKAQRAKSHSAAKARGYAKI
ncbi:hypothetical protein Aduo_005761 [Ancylostoma duodenale]